LGSFLCRNQPTNFSEEPEVFGIKPGWIGFLFLGVVLCSGGFFNLMGYKKGINKAHNLMMMVIWFVVGTMISAASLWRIIGEINR
jgi:hypothetical protein